MHEVTSTRDDDFAQASGEHTLHSFGQLRADTPVLCTVEKEGGYLNGKGVQPSSLQTNRKIVEPYSICAEHLALRCKRQRSDPFFDFLRHTER